MGRPTLLTPEIVEKARIASASGGTLQTIANACGVHLETVRNWLRQGATDDASDLQLSFLTAIQEGRHSAELRALQKITAFEDSRDAQWFLTHHPQCRDTWSDAAATRREVERVLGQVAQGIAASGLTTEQQQAVLLSMRAAGVGVKDAADD